MRRWDTYRENLCARRDKRTGSIREWLRDNNSMGLLERPYILYLPLIPKNRGRGGEGGPKVNGVSARGLRNMFSLIREHTPTILSQKFLRAVVVYIYIRLPRGAAISRIIDSDKLIFGPSLSLILLCVCVTCATWKICPPHHSKIIPFAVCVSYIQACFFFVSIKLSTSFFLRFALRW